MGFDKREDAKKYTPEEGDTLEKIADRETAAGNPLTWQELARFNWGTDDRDEANVFLRDDLGCRLRDADNNFVISADDEPQGELFIPVRFRKPDLPLNTLHEIRVRKKPTPPRQFVECARISGVHFETNKSFIRPSVVADLRKVDDALARNPDTKIMIFGHTDAVGPGSEEDNLQYNKGLADRRARSAYAFITDDAATWEELYKTESWGTLAIQRILKDFGGEFDPGAEDGIEGPQTKQAIRNYQTARGLTVDGIAGPKTREKMFTEYMTGKHDVKATPEQFMDPKHMGCSWYNRVDPTDEACEANRRVTFYLFHKDRLPKLPCKAGSLDPCRRQCSQPLPRYRDSFLCSLYDSMAKRCIREGPILHIKKPRAKLVWPTHQADHRQYINLDSTASSAKQGHRIKIRFKLEDGQPGDKAYLKLDYDETKVSKRNHPIREVVGGLKEAWCPKGGQYFTLASVDEELQAEIELGLAGGDMFTVSVGGTTACADEFCRITNWRQLWYEIMAPDWIGLTDDIGASHRTRVDELLLPCFIEYRVWRLLAFSESVAPLHTVYDAAYFNETGRKQFVLTDHTFTLYPSSNGTWDGGKRPRSVGLRLCDKNYFNERGSSTVCQTFTARKHAFHIYLDRGRYVLPWSASDGTEAIKSIRWVAMVDPSTYPEHPALSSGNPRSGNLPTSVVTFKDITTFEVELPQVTAGTIPGPGQFVGLLGNSTCPIRVTVTFEAADEGLGLAGQGAQAGENLVCYKDSAPQTTVDVMIHEFCHSAGMAAIGSNSPPPGIPQPKTTVQVDPDNECAVSTLGHLYSGHGHSGGHCARGLTDAQKGLPTYAGQPGKCINFGENSLQDPSHRTANICKTCTLILNGRELQSI